MPPDVIVKQLEQLAYFVRQLSPGDQEEFRQHGHRLSADQSDPLVAKQVRAVVDSLLTLPSLGGHS